MKIKHLLFLMMIFAVNKISYSQIIAGSDSTGLYISDPLISLSSSSVGQVTADLIDLDCDSVADLRVELRKGATAIDGANTAYLFVLNPNFLVCADTNVIGLREVTYFSFGDTLNAPDTSAWYADSLYGLGDYGCMECFPPFIISNKYIAYYNTTSMQKGWIKISFDLTDGGSLTAPISLSIPEVLSPCTSTALPMLMSSTDSCGVFSYNYDIFSVSCSSICDGMIQITGLSGGTPSYTYLWNDPAFQTSSTATNLCNGSYSVTFSDGVSNTCTASFFVPSGPPLNYSLVITNTSCAGVADGSICFTGITGGSPPYFYNWPTGSTGSSCNYGLQAGSYSICITDVNGCQSCTTAVVTEPLPIEITFISINNVSCFGECDGSICTSVAGGTGAYSYLWSPIGITTPCISSACSGNYNLCVTDANGCSVCSTAVITELPLFTISTIVTDASCASCCDGDIQINPSGGTIPYIISYTPGPMPMPNSFCADEYYFCVMDVNGCMICDSATVSFATTIDELNNDQILFFPNPNNGNFVIENFISEGEIKITDINGKIVFIKIVQPLNQKLAINTNMENGIYFVYIRNISTNQIVVKKLIIQK